MKSLFSSKDAKVETAKIASVGVSEQQAEILKKSLIFFAKDLRSKWLYIGNFDPNETIDTMGSKIDAEYLLIDIDDEVGKRVWYFLAALRDANKTIAFTQKPWNSDAQFVINKPLSMNIEDLHFDPVIALLNKIDTNIIDTNIVETVKKPNKWRWHI